MTDEEMAEEYVLNLQKKGFNCFSCFSCDFSKDLGFKSGVPDSEFFNQVEQAYLAGLKAGKPRWHKVADEGLPSDSSGQTYVVIDAYNCCALASFDNGTWHNYRNIENVVAWCEIPKFSE